MEESNTPAAANRFPIASPRLLEVHHVAHRLQFTDEHVRRLLRARMIPAIRIGRRWRVDPVVLETFLRTAEYNGESLR